MAMLGDEFTTSVDEPPPELPLPEDEVDPPPHAVSAMTVTNVAAVAARRLNLLIPNLHENRILK